MHTEQSQGNDSGLSIKWTAVNLPDADITYRLFFETYFNGKISVHLLYEGKGTSGLIKGKLQTPYHLYVSAVVKNKKKFDHKAANIVTHPTEQAIIQGTSAAPSNASEFASIG